MPSTADQLRPQAARQAAESKNASLADKIIGRRQGGPIDERLCLP
jgi:hypothetical protein